LSGDAPDRPTNRPEVFFTHGTSAVGRSSSTFRVERQLQPCLRALLTLHGERIRRLFGGYGQAADPSEKRQQRGIAKARKLGKECEARAAREKKLSPEDREALEVFSHAQGEPNGSRMEPEGGKWGRELTKGG
jgi:hypothetical protein